eukprot:GILI01009279.1.p1 GENE.GILI01009279.1~~GILI01009279.1.p1  ORF type:complete len:134 (+),score=19.72 GILI01009279.1:83-484(+)
MSDYQSYDDGPANGIRIAIICSSVIGGLIFVVIPIIVGISYWACYWRHREVYFQQSNQAVVYPTAQPVAYAYTSYPAQPGMATVAVYNQNANYMYVQQPQQMQQVYANQVAYLPPQQVRVVEAVRIDNPVIRK